MPKYKSEGILHEYVAHILPAEIAKIDTLEELADLDRDVHLDLVSKILEAHSARVSRTLLKFVLPLIIAKAGSVPPDTHIDWHRAAMSLFYAYQAKFEGQGMRDVIRDNLAPFVARADAPYQIYGGRSKVIKNFFN
jgi:hypothetical protein